MKRTFLLPALLALGFAMCVVAQTDAEFSGWMKDVAATKGKVTKAVKGKEKSMAETEAMHLAGLFKDVAGYFSSHNMSDAANMAKKAETDSNDIVAAAKSGDEAKMESSLMAVNMDCGACHMAHREGQAGSYKIK